MERSINKFQGVALFFSELRIHTLLLNFVQICLLNLVANHNNHALVYCLLKIHLFNAGKNIRLSYLIKHDCCKLRIQLCAV